MTRVTSEERVVGDTTPSRWTLPIVLVAQFITPMSISGTGIALPQISTDLGANTAALQWVVNGFNVAFALGVLGWGAVSDRIGFRMTFAIGAALFSVSSLISAASPSLLLLDFMRIIAGCGAQQSSLELALCSLTPLKAAHEAEHSPCLELSTDWA